MMIIGDRQLSVAQGLGAKLQATANAPAFCWHVAGQYQTIIGVAPIQSTSTQFSSRRWRFIDVSQLSPCITPGEANHLKAQSPNRHNALPSICASTG
ncbi:hypothetical protein HAX54_042777, partial [Datura stramonium]|nr:hypothetical protein [Datura stramonium]